MLAEITGSLRAINVRDNIVKDISTLYIPSPTLHVVWGEHCRKWTCDVRWTVSDLWLSECDTLHCQMNKQSSTWDYLICDYLNAVHYIIGSTDDDHVFSHDAMSQWTCIDAGYRTLLHMNIEHGRWTLNTEHEHRTLWARTAMISWGMCHFRRVFVFFRVFRWTELYWSMRFNDIVGYLNCVTVTLRNVTVLISVWHCPSTS